jgi:hypothetical protein
MSQGYTSEAQRGQGASEWLNHEHNKDQLFPPSPSSEISNFIMLCYLRGNYVSAISWQQPLTNLAPSRTQKTHLRSARYV